MPSIVNTVKRLIAGLALLVGVAVVKSILYSPYMATPISQHDYVSQAIDVVIIVAFWAPLSCCLSAAQNRL